MININGIPLLEDSECKGIFSEDDCAEGYFINPIYKWLPDFKDLDDDERKKYKFKDLKEGLYLYISG